MTCRQAIKRPQALRYAGLMGVQPKRSARWDASECRFYVGACWAAFNTAATLIAVSGASNGVWTIGLVAGSVSTLSWMGCVGWVVNTLCPRRPSTVANISDEQREHWREIAERISYLKAEIAKRQQHHKQTKPLLDELRALRTQVLIGRDI